MACDGPNGTAWSTTLQACVGSTSACSCDTIAQNTCWYGYLDFIQPVDGTKTFKPGWFGGKFDDAGFRIECVGPLSYLGIKTGDVIQKLNGNIVLPQSLEAFTKDKPAISGEALRYHLTDRSNYGVELTLIS